MSKQCKEICKQYKAEPMENGLKYASGLKRCNYCEVWMIIDGVICPCCHSRLRNKPRTKGGKQHYQAVKIKLEKLEKT